MLRREDFTGSGGHIALWLLLLLLNFLLCSLWAEGAVRDKQGSTRCSKSPGLEQGRSWGAAGDRFCLESVSNPECTSGHLNALERSLCTHSTWGHWHQGWGWLHGVTCKGTLWTVSQV